MAKISKEEYKMLKGLDKEWKWIARDLDGNHGGYLFAYSEKPYKDYYTKDWRGSFLEWLIIDNKLFQFIRWEDEEPYNIAWLLGEYEEAEYGYFNNELYERFYEESEEKEVKKDKKWFVDKWTKERNETDVHDPMYQFISEIIADVNELDEREVLSEYWIEQKSIDTHVDTLSGEIQVTFRLDDLQNLLVPKQELPVIPKFVAEYLDERKECAIYKLLDSHLIYDIHDELARWLYYNDKKTNKEREISLVLAQKYGYELEEEPLYRARLKVITDEFIASYLRTQSSGSEDRLKALEIGSKYIHEDYRHLSEFTEGELKKLDIWASNQWEIEEVEEWC